MQELAYVKPRTDPFSLIFFGAIDSRSSLVNPLRTQIISYYFITLEGMLAPCKSDLETSVTVRKLEILHRIRMRRIEVLEVIYNVLR
jgi:hypothetical protein